MREGGTWEASVEKHLTGEAGERKGNRGRGSRQEGGREKWDREGLVLVRAPGDKRDE